MKNFYDVNDVVAITGYSQSKSYDIIKQMNKELKEKYKRENKNLITFRGRVPIWYFEECTGMKRG